MAQILDGKLVAQKTRERLRREVAELAEEGIVPGLAVVLVGNDVGSQVYVRNKTRACEELGIRSWQYNLPEDTAQAALLELIEKLNADPEVHGILVQSPLPAQIDESLVTKYIRPEKDVDAFHPFNVGRIMLGDYTYLPCTPAGIMEILREYGIDPAGKHCVVVGRSHIVGRPMSMLHAPCQRHCYHLPLPYPGSGSPIPARRTSWWQRWAGSGSSPLIWWGRAPWSSMWA